jgi:nitrile hydratase accessory protein
MNTEHVLNSGAAGGSVCRSIRDELLEEPAQPLLRDSEENPFRNAWEAEAFAMGNLLIKNGFMTVHEWVEVFSQEIRAAQAKGDPDRGDTYYSHWMNALERIFVERGVVDSGSLRERQRLWGLARKNTPHGVALSLDNALNPPAHDHDHHHEHGEMPPEELLRPVSVTTDDGPVGPSTET